MKKLRNIIIALFAILLVAGCGRKKAGDDTPKYNAGLCTSLSQRIERRDSLSQKDYASIISQNEAILQYLVGRADSISHLPADKRYRAWRSLTAEPEYLERFGYMFTLGSALYQADVTGHLDSINARQYRGLDKYNTRLADYIDSF